MGASCHPWQGTLELSGGGGATGFRAYLAVRGGFPEVPKYPGSKSTSMGLGCYQVRWIYTRVFDAHVVQGKSSEAQILVVNVLAGPHDDEFLTSEGIRHVLFDVMVISSSSNRMGIRLQSKNVIQ